MKKIIFLVTIFSFLFIGCNNSATDEKAAPHADSLKALANPAETKSAEKPPIDWTKYTAIPFETVQQMADHYNDLVKEDPSLGIRQINMDGTMLEILLLGWDGLKLIGAADLTSNKITMIMQFSKKEDDTYYDIDDFFNSGQGGMRGQPVLCPPPPDCELPLAKYAKPLVITYTEVQQMVKKYNDLVTKDPSQSIQQVNMSAGLLELLTIGTKGMKLIYGVDLKNNIPTVIMQFWKDDLFYYFNIRDIFTTDMKGMRGQYPLCPPPPGCELPFRSLNKSKTVAK